MSWRYRGAEARRVCIARTMPWQDVWPSVCLSVRPSYSDTTQLNSIIRRRVELRRYKWAFTKLRRRNHNQRMSVILKQRENRTSWRLSGPPSSCLHRTASAFTVNKRGSGLFWHSLIEHSRFTLFDNICCSRRLIYHWRRDAVDKLINQSIKLTYQT